MVPISLESTQQNQWTELKQCGKQNCLSLKATWSVRGFYFYCKIILYGINYCYYCVKTVKICFHVPFRG